MDDSPRLMLIDGYFNANDEPAIKLDLFSFTIEFLVDTGFAGGLIIPEQLSAGLDFTLKASISS